LPLRYAGGWRKRWRYLGAYSDELMLCAARVQVGPLGQTFWAFWDRGERELHERTVLRPPFVRGEVWGEDGAGRRLGYNAPDEGCVVRVSADTAEATLRAGPGVWAESVCPNGEGGFVWTRKRPVRVEYEVHLGQRRLRGEAMGLEDESAGYHPRHTVWSWSAGVGVLTDGRSVAWNLVEGVNDPAERSERAIWVDGVPSEPAPVEFEGLEAIRFGDGSRLDFSAEAERRAQEDRRIVRYSYRQPFGTFTGALPGGLRLGEAQGVMEHHDALW
jgi:hypothetical protein